MVINVLLLHLISFDVLTFESAHDAGASFAITVGVHGFGHTLVGCGVIEEGAYFINYKVVVGADEVYCAALEGFGTFGGVAHHEDGLAQTGGLFLDAAAVGEDDGGFLHQIDELQVLERFDQKHVPEV